MKKKALSAAPPLLVVCAVLPAICAAGPGSLWPNRPSLHDGAHDFDFELGTWKVHLERLAYSSSGSPHWDHWDDGELATPAVGEFRNGRGEFYDQETYRGRMVLMRGLLTHSSEGSARFEQASSVDGGKTWEVNFTEQFTRLSHDPIAAGASNETAATAAPSPEAHQKDK